MPKRGKTLMLENNVNTSGPQYNFAGRTALITGAASGIGREIALQLASTGANVVVADIAPERKNVVDFIENHDGNVVGVEVDVCEPHSVENMVATANQHFNGIDIFVHCAGIGIEKPFLETSLDDWNKIINVDLTGTFLCCRAVARTMLNRNWGRIITLASTAGIRGGFNRAAYGAAKGAVISLTKVMAVELAPYGITVNALAPGAIETEMVSKMHSPETRKIYTAAIPAARYGTPSETAAAAIFLASEQASYINGHILAVDGGFLAAGLMKEAIKR